MENLQTKQTSQFRLAERNPKKTNWLLYGRSGSGKTHLSCTSPKPVVLSFGESETTVLVDFPDIPVIQADEQVMAAVIEESDYVWSTAFSGTRFEGYVPETIVADSATMLAQDLMGKPNVYGENHKLQSKGCGIMAIDRNRADDAPALEDYKILNFKMV